MLRAMLRLLLYVGEGRNERGVLVVNMHMA